MSHTFKIRPSQKIQDNQHLSPLLERIFSARGITSVEQLDYSLKQLIHPDDIYQMPRGATFLADAIQSNQRILIVGDYDADGATSTALMMKGLALLGADSVDFILPDRISEGYGLSLGLVQRIITLKPELVITVDTGISSIEGIKALRNADINVLVTDHHLPATELPDANVIINPNAYSKEISPHGRCLAGVGVAFYLLLATRSQLRKDNYFQQGLTEPNLALLLDLVALGSVADLVPLDHLNRILIKQGLDLIKQKKCSDGITQLFRVSEKNQLTANHQDLGFAIAPRINAAGRIDHMSLGVECLLANGHLATTLAVQLNDINSQRRALQQDMEIDSEGLLKQITIDQSYPKGIVLTHQDWHEGVVGIVASKIKQKTYRPTFIFAQAEDGLLKGSGRSIQGIHLRDVLDLMDKRNDGLIVKFGGHAMAAGLSIENDRLNEFNRNFNVLLEELYEDDVFSQHSLSDGTLTNDELNLETVEQINNAGPWGQCFEEPEFTGVFKVIQQRILKQQHIKLVLADCNDDSLTLDAIAFFCKEPVLNANLDEIEISYRLSINEFRGKKSLQLMINDFLSF